MRRGMIGMAFAVWSAAALAQGASPMDGVYRGDATIQGAAGGRAAAGRCPPTISFALRVAGGSFQWKLPTGSVAVQVGPDGRFSATNALRYLNGAIQGTHLAATTTGRGCNYVWSLDRQ